jgi:glycosyltransferase involved in cell wall biosynthesis
MAHIFVNPSYGEGMPNAVLEAMACGLAIVVSDIPPHREMITPEVEGLFCAPRDVETLTAALSRLVADPALRQRLGEQARRRAISEFSWDQKAAELLTSLHQREPRMNMNDPGVAEPQPKRNQKTMNEH